MRTRGLLSLLLVVASLALVACSEEPPPAPVDTTPIVGALELALSNRNDAPAPSNALRIEINQSELRLDSVRVYELERGGRPPAAEITPEGLRTLRERIDAAPARGMLTLTVHGAVPYGTTVRALQTGLAAGYREIRFAVRPPNAPSPTTTGWLSLSSPLVVPAEGAVRFSAPPRPWSDFGDHWNEIYTACRGGRFIDCDPVPAAIAVGGNLEVALWARGNGMFLRFNQVDAPDAGVPTAGPALLDGVRAPGARAGEEEVVPPTPRDTGAFSFRFEEASAAESAISLAARPVCGAASCPIVIEADEETQTMRVLSLLGATVPNGAMEPFVAFRLPETR